MKHKDFVTTSLLSLSLSLSRLVRKNIKIAAISFLDFIL